MTTEAGFAIIDHTADTGVRAWGRDLADALGQAVIGMFSLLVPPQRVRPRQRWSFAVTAPDLPLLLFNLLDELLYLHHSQRALAAAVRDLAASIEGQPRAAGTLLGETIDRRRHRLQTEIKAVTLHGIRLEREGSLWIAEAIFDL
ncbi:MAG TPA: archease [Bacillota bacterium]